MTRPSESPTSQAPIRHATAAPTVDFPLQTPPEAPSFRALLIGAPLVAAMLGVGLGAMLRLHPATPLGVVTGALTFLAAWLHVRRVRLEVAAAARAQGRVTLDATTLRVIDGESSRALLRVDAPFGATLFATPTRDRLLLALTHRDGVAHLAGLAPRGSRHVELLARAITTPAADLPFESRAATFADADRLLDLVAALEARAPGAVDRVILSDAGMADLVLDGDRLRAGTVDFDLTRPLAWRGYSFQEGGALGAHVFAATQLRQADREIVLVSLAPVGEIGTPSLLPLDPREKIAGPLAESSVQHAIARDLRLARALVDMPPARASRVAIDRLFMPRIRQALDRAPYEETRIATPLRMSAIARSEAPIPTPPEGIERLRQSRP